MLDASSYVRYPLRSAALFTAFDADASLPMACWRWVAVASAAGMQLPFLSRLFGKTGNGARAWVPFSFTNSRKVCSVFRTMDTSNPVARKMAPWQSAANVSSSATASGLIMRPS
eukprot:1672575-Pyramimonas_sp.AAC.1